jgi:hypothetical protein
VNIALSDNTRDEEKSIKRFSKQGQVTAQPRYACKFKKKNQNLWVKRENHKLRIALKPTEEVKNMREKRTIESKGNGSLHFRKASAVLPS